MVYVYTPSHFNHDIDKLTNILDTSLPFSGVYGIPRGGVPVAVALSERLDIPLVDDPGSEEILVVDDLIDTGNTMAPYVQNGFITAALCRKARAKVDDVLVARHLENEWVEFFWEKSAGGPEDAVVRLLEFIGQDPEREGLKETPKTFIKSCKFLMGGYRQAISPIVKTFEKESYDQIVLLKDIELYSMCEHHCLPFWGRAHVAYIPRDKVIGVSKLARIVDVFSRRLQIQERLGEQITKTIMDVLDPDGAACIIEASHLCMRMRGVQKQNSNMVTSSLKGVFFDNQKARQELMQLIRGN